MEGYSQARKMANEATMPVAGVLVEGTLKSVELTEYGYRMAVQHPRIDFTQYGDPKIRQLPIGSLFPIPEFDPVEKQWWAIYDTDSNSTTAVIYWDEPES